MNTILEQIGLIGIVPVVAIEDAAHAEPLARALSEGGIPCIEVTFRTAAAKETLQRIATSLPDMLLGAGTVLTVEQAATAFGSGAKFVVAPGLNRKVVEYCLKNGVPVSVLSLVRGIKQRVYPVGRLDYHSSGLMILTNDGELANYLMSRASSVPRTYHVKLQGRPEAGEIAKLESGVVLDGRRTAPCQVRPLAEGDKPWYEITLVEGRYHQVRRMFERIGQPVIKLRRVRIAFLTDRGLRPGELRHLTRAEVERLKNWKGAR